MRRPSFEEMLSMRRRKEKSRVFLGRLIGEVEFWEYLIGVNI